MNRTIKFRVWDNKTKIYYSPEYLKHFKVSIGYDGKIIYQNFICGDKKVGEEVFVQQFTGLLDKNGREIYEGDIINVTDFEFKNLEVIISEYGPAFILILEQGGLYLLWEIRNKSFEVIGNTFENPELLK